VGSDSASLRMERAILFVPTTRQLWYNVPVQYLVGRIRGILCGFKYYGAFENGCPGHCRRADGVAADQQHGAYDSCR